MQVTAADGDRDRFQDIVYFLTGQGIDVDNPDNSKFEVNRTSGAIYVRKVIAVVWEGYEENLAMHTL